MIPLLRTSATLCLLLLYFPFFSNAENLERIVVLDLEPGHGIEESLAVALSTVIRDEIHNYGIYTVMSQSDLQQVATREQLLQAMGCDEGGNCLVDFGRAIGTRFMVVGAISKIGKTYTFNLRLLDTKGENAGLVKRASELCKCSDDDLIKTVQILAASIFDEKRKAGKELNSISSASTEDPQKRDIITTASGLKYKVLNEGKGRRPSIKDTVKVHYKGTLLDGTEVDSSYRRGQPAVFGVNQVIPGWVEGLQLMRVGSVFKLYIPPELAYGERGAGSQIPPGSTLIFDLELIDIN